MEGVVNALSSFAGPEAEAALVSQLYEPDAWIRVEEEAGWIPSHADAVVRALTRMGGQTLAVKSLCALLTSPHLDSRARPAVLYYLEDMALRITPGGDLWRYGEPLSSEDSQLVIGHLRSELRGDSARDMARTVLAIRSLGGHRDAALRTSVRDDLTHVLAGGAAVAGANAVEALALLGDRSAIPALRHAAERDPNLVDAVRWATGWLGRWSTFKRMAARTGFKARGYNDSEADALIGGMPASVKK